MVSMSGIGSPVGIGIVRSNYSDSSTRASDAMQLGNKRHHVRNVFDHMATDYLVKLIGRERVRQYSQIVNDISMTAWIRIDANSAGVFILPTAYVKDLSRSFGCRLVRQVAHESRIRS